MFDLGYLIFNCAIGAIELEDLSLYSCTHKDKCCCFYHCLIKSESNGIMIANLIKNYSEEFIKFICCLTSYSFEDLYKIKNHPWLSNLEAKQDYITINLIELLQASYVCNNFRKQSIIKIDRLADNISLLLPTFKDFDKMKDNVFSQISETSLNELSIDLTVDKEILISKLKPLYDKIFKNKR
jgi:hypothetical protein